MSDEEQNKLLQDISVKINFILDKLGYNPFTLSPHGNGILGRVGALEKNMKALSPAKMVKAAAAAISSAAVVGGALIWLVKHFAGG